MGERDPSVTYRYGRHAREPRWHARLRDILHRIEPMGEPPPEVLDALERLCHVVEEEYLRAERAARKREERARD